MSIGTVEPTRDMPLASRGPQGLTLTIAPKGPRDVRPTASTCGVHNPGDLLDLVARFSSVLIGPCDGGDPDRLRRQRHGEPTSRWIDRVVAAVVPHVEDVQIACELVGAALGRRAGATVVIEFRAARVAGDQPDEWAAHAWVGAATAFTREVPLMYATSGVWLLTSTSRSLDPVVDAPDLLAALMTRLRKYENEVTRHEKSLRQQLAKAVSRGDAQAFVDVAAELIEGPVCLEDRSGAVVASGGPGAGAGSSYKMPLLDCSGLRGALVLDGSDRSTGRQYLDLTDLSLALLRVRDAISECQQLENRLAVLSCFVEQDVDLARRQPEVAAHRLVMIRPAAGPLMAGETLVNRLLEAAASVPQLSGLSLVPRSDALLGAYSDHGGSPESHRAIWETILHKIDRTDSLCVVISAHAHSGRTNKQQHAAIDQVSHLQRDGEGYFDLPAIVVIDHLGPLAGVLHAVPAQQVVPYVKRVLGDLIDDDRFGGQLIETLYAYLQTGGSPRGAGALLHLHGSSVKYRMRVLRELLGDRLDSHGKRFDLELALRLYLAGRSLTNRPVS